MQETERRPLGRINPLTLLAVALFYIIVITVVFDAGAQALVLALTVVVLLAVERVPPGRLLAVMLPFALMGFGFWWTNIVFQRESADYIASLGRFSLVNTAGFDAGLVVFLRAINFGTISYLFVHATRPADLALALMQKLRLPPAIAYAIFTAVQFIPALRDDLRQLRLARMLRRRGAKSRWRTLPAEYGGLLIPLLASAIRRAQRSAISMEARGLSRPMTRTYLRQSRWRAVDVGFALFAVALLALIVARAISIS